MSTRSTCCDRRAAFSDPFHWLASANRPRMRPSCSTTPRFLERHGVSVAETGAGRNKPGAKVPVSVRNLPAPADRRSLHLGRPDRREARPFHAAAGTGQQAAARPRVRRDDDAQVAFHRMGERQRGAEGGRRGHHPRPRTRNVPRRSARIRRQRQARRGHSARGAARRHAARILPKRRTPRRLRPRRTNRHRRPRRPSPATESRTKTRHPPERGSWRNPSRSSTRTRSGLRKTINAFSANASWRRVRTAPSNTISFNR